MTPAPDASVPLLAFLPSPSQGVWELGPVPIRAYALCILAGIGVAIWLSNRRWLARGGDPTDVGDVAMWAVPFGLVGARIYHVITSPQGYFGADGDFARVFRVWEGGLSIWGAVALGGVGAWIGCRRKGISLARFADAAAPGIALAQAIGRLGNWFNQELYGRATTVPWALEIDGPQGAVTTHHPTFLYEMLWNIGVAALVLWADRRFRLDHGRAFALYVAAYSAGRFWIELLRVDEAEQVLGVRLNAWVSVLVFLGAVAYFVLARRPSGHERAAETPATADAAEDLAANPELSEPAEDGPRRSMTPEQPPTTEPESPSADTSPPDARG